MTVTKVFGARSVSVRVGVRGPVWRRHIEQLQPRYGAKQDTDEVTVSDSNLNDVVIKESGNIPTGGTDVDGVQPPPLVQEVPEYGLHNPRRSNRTRKATKRYCPTFCDSK